MTYQDRVDKADRALAGSRAVLVEKSENGGEDGGGKRRAENPLLGAVVEDFKERAWKLKLS